jgi:hypothetical protein
MPHVPDAVHVLERELRAIFGARLHSLVVYGLGAAGGVPPHHGPAADHDGPAIHTLALVEALGAEDLRGCAVRAAGWHDAGLATPLLLARAEFARSLDAFPLEFGAILADHVVVAGTDPFEQLQVEASDLRRACEVQARSHLLHLREGFIETRGRADALSLLILQSAAPLAALVHAVARLHGRPNGDPQAAAREVERTVGADPGSLGGVIALEDAADLSSADGERMFPGYLAAVERLVSYVDEWAAK